MDVINLISWVVFDLIVGIVANMIDPNPNRMGILGSIALGIVGAVLGGLIAGLFGFSGVTGFNFTSFIVAVIGALVVLWVGRSLVPGGAYGPEYYDEDADVIEEKTTTRK